MNQDEHIDGGEEPGICKRNSNQKMTFNLSLKKDLNCWYQMLFQEEDVTEPLKIVERRRKKQIKMFDYDTVEVSTKPSS